MGKTDAFYQRQRFSDGQKSFIAPHDLIEFCILAELSMGNPNLRSIFSWDLLEIFTLANRLNKNEFS